MQLLGLSLLKILAVLGAASVAIVLLYLLRVRRREVLVPFAPLFDELLMEQRRERLFDRFRFLLSLLLALLFAAALAFALGDPRRSEDGMSGRSLVVLVDVSASAQARPSPTEPSRLARAIGRLHALIDDMGPNDSMLLATVGERLTPRSGLTDDLGELHAAADAIRGEEAGVRLRPAVDFALDVLRDRPHGEIILLSADASPLDPSLTEASAEAHIQLSRVTMADPLPNVGILSFAARRLPLDRGRALASIELYASSAQDRSVELVISDSGHPIYSERLELPARERLRPELPVLSGAEHRLEAHVRTIDDGGDALALDDHAFAVLPARHRSRVLAVGRGDLYLSAALLLDELLEVQEMTPEQFDAAPESEEDVDVVIFDECLPQRAPRRPAIYLRPEPTEGRYAPFEVDGELSTPYFARVERRSPLLRYVALDDVNIGHALKIRPQVGDRILGAAPGGPLLVRGEREDQPFVAFAFAPRASDLVLRVAWPVLLLDTIESFHDPGGDEAWSLRTGDTREVRLPDGVREAVWIEPDGTRRLVHAPESTLRVTPETVGVHRLEFQGGGVEWAANLARLDETRTLPVDPPTVDTARAPSHGQPGLRREVWPLLVLFGLLWLCLESWAWHRRWVI